MVCLFSKRCQVAFPGFVQFEFSELEFGGANEPVPYPLRQG